MNSLGQCLSRTSPILGNAVPPSSSRGPGLLSCVACVPAPGAWWRRPAVPAVHSGFDGRPQGRHDQPRQPPRAAPRALPHQQGRRRVQQQPQHRECLRGRRGLSCMERMCLRGPSGPGCCTLVSQGFTRGLVVQLTWLPVYHDTGLIGMCLGAYITTPSRISQ